AAEAPYDELRVASRRRGRHRALALLRLAALTDSSRLVRVRPRAHIVLQRDKTRATADPDAVERRAENGHLERGELERQLGYRPVQGPAQPHAEARPVGPALRDETVPEELGLSPGQPVRHVAEAPDHRPVSDVHASVRIPHAATSDIDAPAVAGRTTR